MAASSSDEVSIPQRRPEKTGRMLYFGTTDFEIVAKAGKAKESLAGAWGPHRLRPFENVKVRLVASGSSALHVVIVDETGKAFTWGRNKFGQLGLGDTVQRSGPEPVAGVKDVVDAACGKTHTLLVTRSGQCWAFGNNENGQLGCGKPKMERSETPVKVAMENVARVACGADFSVAVNESGQMFNWGTPMNGVLGNGVTSGHLLQANKISYDYEFSPIAVGALRENKIRLFACGDEHTLAVDSDGKVFTWGFGGYGRLGHKEAKDEPLPKQIMFFNPMPVGREASRISALCCGYACCFVATEAKRNYFWGAVRLTGEAVMYPKPFADFSGWNINSISVGRNSVLCAADTSVITFGSTVSFGELGLGDPAKGAPKSSANAKLVDSLSNFNTFQTASGYCSSLVLIEETPENKSRLDAFPLLQSVGVSADDGDEAEGAAAGTKRKKAPAKKPAAAASTKKKGKSK